jgi:signal transduction histidine kinase
VTEVERYVRAHTGAVGTLIETAFEDRLLPVPDALFQVLANLLSNSLQAMSGRGLVRVSSRAVSGALEIVVADDGPGMPPAYRETLFKPFFSTKPYGQGSGLGLPICRQIMQSLGGTLSLESVPGKGTTVTLTIPAAPPRTGS